MFVSSDRISGRMCAVPTAAGLAGIDGQDHTGRISGETSGAHLSTMDCVSLIMGIVIGVSIFKVPAPVFRNVNGPWLGLAAWLAGGVLSAVGALCYAELAATYPKMGGDYHYLGRAFHPFVGFLFGWSRLAIIQTGSIGALSYVFADYTSHLLPALNPVPVAVTIVLLLSILNLMGISYGKSAQNIFTIIKVLTLAAIICAGFFLNGNGKTGPTTEAAGDASFGSAMVLILYAYGGWSEAAFVAAEMRDHRHGIPTALIISIIFVTAVYLAINLAYIVGLGFESVRNSTVPAAEILRELLGNTGMRIMSGAVLVSVLGALNGNIITGSRVYVALGSDQRRFRLLGRWWKRSGTPVWAFLIQGSITGLTVAVVGTEAGRTGIDGLLASIGLPGPIWEKYGGGFETLVSGTAPVFWLFLFLSGCSLFILRRKDKETPRAYSVPWYPLLPATFCGTCLFMLYHSIVYAGGLSFLGILILVMGAPLYSSSGTSSPG